ncbi:hypothetical protein IFM46972_03063 [Aspergillus udagawae]|uniref:Oxidoreductase AflY n=1 Tax=Aspergillus udagawae TaxID=91492 RepID=A0A8H3NG41_9EURO|nr:hypothetical protein IFM46972_03063 [Aspergillus udagawae]
MHSHSSWTARGITIPPVQIHDIGTATEDPARTLNHYLKANHARYSLLYHGKLFHNHVPHILSSAYLLGAGAGDLKRLYEAESRGLEPWADSPSDVTTENWRDCLGKKEYERGFVKFFQGEVAREGGDWKKVAAYYLFSGKQPLINSVVAGAGHALIHLGYAYHMSSTEIGTEAIALTATDYNGIHKYLEDEAYSQVQPPYKSPSPLEILEKVRTDERFNRLSRPGYSNLDTIFREYETPLLEHWNAWTIDSPVEQFRESQKAAAAMAVAANKHDFFLIHILTTSHAIRVLLPLIPAQFHTPVLRQWWLITVALYIAQLRPKITPWEILEYNIKGRDWDWPISSALKGQHSIDAHYVKAIHALKEACDLWGDSDSFFLKAAVKFADEFHGWSGFS